MGAAGVIASVIKTVTPSVDLTEAAGIEFTGLQSKATYFTREF
jgi:hypothetical protein